MDRIAQVLNRYSHVAVFLALLLSGAGIYSYFHIPRALEPNVSYPFATIEAKLPGVTADELEDMVTIPIEKRLQQIGNIVHFTSRTYDGYILVAIEARNDATLKESWKRVKAEMDDLNHVLKRTIIGLEGPKLNLSMNRANDLIVGIPIANDQLESDYRSIRQLTTTLSDLRHVDHVEVIGKKKATYVIEYLDGDLDASGLSPGQLSQYLATQSFLAPGGYIDKDGTLTCVQLDSRLKSLEELKHLEVMDPHDGGVTSLERVLDVNKVYSEAFVPITTANGKASVCLAISRNASSDPSVFSLECRERIINECQKLGLASPVFLLDNSIFIEHDVRSLLKGLLVSALIVFAILLFVLGVNSGSVVATMIPACIFSTLSVLFLLGHSLNLVSLAGLIIAIGVIVDNHVVISQSISYKVNSGVEHVSALADAIKKLLIPLTIATLTTIVGFSPVVLAKHEAGSYVRELLPVIAIALAFSLLYSFFVTPALCRRGHRRKWLILWLESSYSKLMQRLCSWPKTVYVAMVLVIVLGAVSIVSLPTSFFPTKNRPVLFLEIHHSPDRSIEFSHEQMESLDKQIAPLFTRWQTVDPTAARMTFAGRGVPRYTRNMIEAPQTPNVSMIVFSFENEELLDRAKAELTPIIEGLKEKAVVRLYPMAAGPQVKWPIQLIATGSRQHLLEHEEGALDSLRTISGIKDVHTASGTSISKLVVVPKRHEAAARGISSADIEKAMVATLHGIPCTELQCNNQSIPVLLRPQTTKTDPISRIRDAYVYPLRGSPCLIEDVADIKTHQAPAMLQRHNGSPCVTFLASVEKKTNPYKAEKDAEVHLQKKLSGTTITVSAAGLSKTASDANLALFKAIPWAVLGIVLLLLLQTASVRYSFMIFLAIPFGIMGCGVALYLTNEPFGFMPILGIAAMAGVAVNNAIVLTCGIRFRIANPVVNRRTAIIEASAERIEPILLSSLCTIGGMVPLYLYGGAMWQSMALVMAAGVPVAAIVSLLALPVCVVASQDGRSNIQDA